MIRGAQGDFDVGMLQQAAEIAVVLLCQNLGGCNHGCNLAAAHGQEHGAKGHQGLAAAHIALKQAVHLARGGHILPYFLHTALLCRCKAERELRQ